jgi:hypothetical protein
MLRKKFYVLANKYLEQAIKKWDGDEQDLAQVNIDWAFSPWMQLKTNTKTPNCDENQLQKNPILRCILRRQTEMVTDNFNVLSDLTFHYCEHARNIICRNFIVLGCDQW